MHSSIDPIWLETGTPVTLDQLAQASGMNAGELDELVDYGTLVPAQPSAALLYSMLARIDALEQQVRSLRARMPAHLQGQHEGPQPWHEPHAGMRSPGH